MRPILRPGLQVLRRDQHTLQLGLDWPGLATLRDSPAIRAVLSAIDGCREVDTVVEAAVTDETSGEEAAAALADLVAAGAVVDQAATSRGTVSEAGWAALWLLAGPERDPRHLLRRRLGRTVTVQGSGTVAVAARTALASTGIPTTDDVFRADVVVLASDHEPVRELGDPVMRSGQAHLWVSVRELVGVVGPYVCPGSSPCLRCVDAARADLDPAWPTLLDAAAARPLVVPACDPALAGLVGAWAALEVSVWASGIEPQSWGTVIEIPSGFGPLETVAFDPHPRCGCGWASWRDTMGA